MNEFDSQDAKAGRTNPKKPLKKILVFSLILAIIAFFAIWYL